ncbi:OsmC family protein [Daejeonella sp.]|uniref:OsmC family protein n=1 Tax=Daejeonella sp. TaxID=2805397 RepID=UPI003982FF3D
MDQEHCIGTSCTSVEIGTDKYRSEIRASGHSIIADEPTSSGGEDLGINPNELLLASLGTCTAMTLKMYADHKEWPVDRIFVDLTMDIVKGNQQQTTYIKRHIRIEGSIDEEQRQRILQIADSCPLHRIITNPIVITSNLMPGKEE